jgi:hypothetical protein
LSARAPVISEICASLYVNGPTKSVPAQKALLEAVASEPATAPSHGGLDELKPLPVYPVAGLDGVGPGVLVMQQNAIDR